MSVTTLPSRYRVLMSHLAVSIGVLSKFQADPLSYVWVLDVPDKKADFDWLNTNTPGWTTEVSRGTVVEKELPIGGDPTGLFLDMPVYLLFKNAEHRDAWLARSEVKADERRLHRARMKEAHDCHPDGHICEGCYQPLVRRQIHETARIGQFAIVYPAEHWTCATCSDADIVSSADALGDLRDDIYAKIGLPVYGDLGWHEGLKHERARREEAPALYEVSIEPGMTRDEVLSVVDGYLRKSKPSFKLRVV